MSWFGISLFRGMLERRKREMLYTWREWDGWTSEGRTVKRPGRARYWKTMIYDNGVFFLSTQPSLLEAKREREIERESERRRWDIPLAVPSELRSYGRRVENALITLINISREVWRSKRPPPRPLAELSGGGLCGAWFSLLPSRPRNGVGRWLMLVVRQSASWQPSQTSTRPIRGPMVLLALDDSKRLGFIIALKGFEGINVISWAREYTN